MRRIPIAPEAWLFILPAIILAAAALLIHWYTAAIVFSFIAALLLGFFRDPERRGSERHVDILAPADGVVVEIRDVDEGHVWPGLSKQVTIMASIFDVPVNRAPISGRIAHFRHVPAGAKPAPQAAEHVADPAERNEQNFIVIEAKGTTVAIRQVGGLLARRVVFDRKEGDEVARGERIGMIRFGSRVDLYLPTRARIDVAVNDRVLTGLTIVAELEGS